MRTVISIFTSIIAGAAFFTLSTRATPGCFGGQFAQTRLIGEVVGINTDMSFDIRADSGGVAHFRVDERTRVLRVPAGETSLARAEQVSPNEIAVGDRLLASGWSSGSSAPMIATQIVVMSHNDIQKMRQREVEEWRTRGIAGVVTAINPQTREIVLLPRGRQDATPVVIAASEATRFRRYAVDSVKFSDAKTSSLAEIKRGDHLRALGERTPDGARFKPEEIVSGSFLTVVGVVSGISSSTGEIKVNVQGIPQPIALRVSMDATLRRITPKLAASLIRENGVVQAGKSPAGSSGNEVLESLAPMVFSDLKQGAVLAFTSAATRDLSHLTAVTVVGGIDVLIAELQKQAGRPSGPALSSGLPSGLLDTIMGQP